MGGGSPSKTTSVQDIPKEFKPAYTSLFNSAFGAARTAAGQPGFPSNPYGTQSPQSTNFDPSGYAGGDLFSTAGNIPTTTYNPQQDWQATSGYGSDGTQNAPYQQHQGNVGTKTDFVDGSFQTYEGAGTGIPLAAGPPIIGTAYDGQFLAGANPQMLAALQGREEVANSLWGAGNNISQLGQETAAGKYLDFSSNPYAQAALMSALKPTISNFENSVMPQFNSAALQSGAFKGSSARDMAFNQLGDAFGGNLANTAADFQFKNYMAERQLQQNAGQLIDQGARLNQLSPEIMSQVGAGYQDLYQTQLDEQLLRFQEQQQAPFRPLMNLASIIHGGDIGTQFTNFGPQPSKAAGGITGALGGAAGGYGLASAAGATGAGALGGAAGLGGLLGGLGGALL